MRDIVCTTPQPAHQTLTAMDHLDDSFYNYMDTSGRGSRVRDEGNDRPTPPEMMRVLTSLIGRRTLCEL